MPLFGTCVLSGKGFENCARDFVRGFVLMELWA